MSLQDLSFRDVCLFLTHCLCHLYGNRIFKSLAPQNAKVINHVILISVDGLRPELLKAPLIEKHPSMARLLRGPHTFEARTDPDSTVTLPNHVGMVTGRLFAGPLGHNWLGNSDPPQTWCRGNNQRDAWRICCKHV